MKPTTTPRVKICCISSIDEARMAIDAGASAIGLVSAMPSGPGVIPEDTIALIAAAIPSGVSSFLLTSQLDALSIIAQQRRCGTNTIQLVDAVPIDVYRELRDAMPGVVLVQVIHVRGEASIHEANSVAGFVDALLLDSGNPTLAIKELGGTGRTHNWSFSRMIRESVDIPVFLAGGLNPANVVQAIHEVAPYGLDLCSGVRTDGRLDSQKLARFFEAIHSSYGIELS